MDLKQRIKYWAGRASLAKRLGQEDEARMCQAVKSILVDYQRDTDRVEARIDQLVDAMPVEEYEGANEQR